MTRRTSSITVARALVLAVTTLALRPSSVVAQGDGETEETIRYTIQPGDTCYGIAQRFFGNPRQCHEVIYRYNPQMGSDASNIRPGVVITIPVRTQNSPDARVTRTSREVQARSSSGASRNCRRRHCVWHALRRWPARR